MIFLQKSIFKLIILDDSSGDHIAVRIVFRQLDHLYYYLWDIFFTGVLVLALIYYFSCCLSSTRFWINPSEMGDNGFIFVNSCGATFAIFVVAFYLFFLILMDDKRIFTHPFAIIIYIYLSWILIMSLTSTEKIVSILSFDCQIVVPSFLSFSLLILF